MFRKGGEVQASAALGNGFEAQGAVAISNHIALTTNFSYVNNHSNQYTVTTVDDEEVKYHRFFEGGLGYYTNQGNWCYEIIGGYGRGEGEAYDNYDFWGSQNVTATGKYDRIFFQPAFGMNKKLFHFAIIPRISIVDFKEFVSDVATVPINPSAEVFFEPAFLGRVNLADNHLMLNFQVGFSVPVESDPFYDYRIFQISTGLGFRFGGLHANKGDED